MIIPKLRLKVLTFSTVVYPKCLKQSKKSLENMEGEQPQFSVFKTVLAYSVFILASPVLTFFFTKFAFFEGFLGISSTSSNVWSAVLAVVVLHVALGLYIHRAYSEADRTKGKPSEKVD